MFDSVLIANRGEIARRVIRTARRMGIQADRRLLRRRRRACPYVSEADEAVLHRPGRRPPSSYLDAARCLGAARKTGAAAVHPGYGFLAENAGFARAGRPTAGLTWIGPPPVGHRADGRQDPRPEPDGSRRACRSRRAPPSRSPTRTRRSRQAGRIGYPVMVKAAAGGGGIGMSAALDADAAARRRSRPRAPGPSGSSARPRSCSSATCARARHVEVQILGLADGRVLALGERDCSVQRRHQKVAEETPSPGRLRRRCGRGCWPAAVRAGRGGRLPRRGHGRVPGGHRDAATSCSWR